MEYGHFKRKDRGDFRDRTNDRAGGDRRDFRDNRGDNRYRGGYGDRSSSNYGDRGGFNDRGGYDRGADRDPEESVFSKRVRAGKRRTYFFDVRKTRGNDFFITITESTRREEGFGYKRHKIFLYKEDFNRFVQSLNEVVQHVKTDLMPDFDYEEFDRRQAEWEAQNRDFEEEEFERDPEQEGGEEPLDPGQKDRPRDEQRREDDEMSW